MPHAVREIQAAGGAGLGFVTRSEAEVEDAIGDGGVILGPVEIPLSDFELGERDNLLRRENRELDVFAEEREAAQSAPKRPSPRASFAPAASLTLLQSL